MRDAPPRGVSLGIDDLAVVNNNGIPPRPLPHGPANGLAELCVGVRHEELSSQSAPNNKHPAYIDINRERESESTKGVRDKKGKAYNRIVVDAVRLAPRRHDEGVVEGDEDDGIHALGLEFVQVGQVRGDVLFLAGRGEGAGDGDQDYFFVGEF